MNRHAQQYVNEWATLTGKSPREIYVPLALRDPEVKPVHRFEVILLGPTGQRIASHTWAGDREGARERVEEEFAKRADIWKGWTFEFAETFEQGVLNAALNRRG